MGGLAFGLMPGMVVGGDRAGRGGPRCGSRGIGPRSWGGAGWGSTTRRRPRRRRRGKDSRFLGEPGGVIDLVCGG